MSLYRVNYLTITILENGEFDIPVRDEVVRGRSLERTTSDSARPVL